jgi:hypothetical protein
MREHSLVKRHWQIFVVYPQYSQSLIGLSGILSSLMLPSPVLPRGYWYSVLEHNKMYFPSINPMGPFCFLLIDVFVGRLISAAAHTVDLWGWLRRKDSVKIEKLNVWCKLGRWWLHVAKSQLLALKWRCTYVELMHLEETFQSRCVTIIKVHEFISRHT